MGVSGQRHAAAALYPPGERTPGTHLIGDWVGPRVGLDAGARRKILCPCRGSNSDRPARSQTLYCLSYDLYEHDKKLSVFEKARNFLSSWVTAEVFKRMHTFCVWTEVGSQLRIPSAFARLPFGRMLSGSQSQVRVVKETRVRVSAGNRTPWGLGHSHSLSKLHRG
jgi:hypothetical protein